jgi:uncharacterized protein YxeA
MGRPTRACANCGKSFVGRSDKRCCTRYCIAALWRRRHPEAVAASRRKWNSANNERVKAHNKNYYVRHRDEVLKKRRILRSEQPDRFRAYSAKAYQRHGDEIRARARAYAKANGAKIQAYVKNHRRIRGHYNEWLRRTRQRYGDLPNEILEMMLLAHEFRMKVRYG